MITEADLSRLLPQNRPGCWIDDPQFWLDCLTVATSIGWGLAMLIALVLYG